MYLLKMGNGKIYIGYTNNLQKRMEKHISGKSLYTAKYLPVELIYYEAFKSEEDARNREKRLKHHGKGIAELKLRLKSSIK